MKIWLFLIGLGSSVHSKVSYDGFSVVETEPRGPADVSRLTLASSCSLLAEWVAGTSFLCSRKQATKLRREAKRLGIKSRFSTRHLGRQIKEEETQASVHSRADQINTSKHKQKPKRIINHEEFLSADKIFGFIDELEKQNGNVNVSSIGSSFEGRPIKLVKINGGRGLPKILVDAGIHAREWISPAATLFVLERLARSIARRADRIATGEYEWHVLPLANPDGYEYSRTTDRMWRKNTRKNPGSKCVGVDLNRNFPEGYGIGASKNPCSEVYQGPNPLSEPESVSLNSYVEATKGIKAAVSVHSFGNVLIFPWGYTTTPHKNKSKLSKMANFISEHIEKKTKEFYKPGTAREVFGSWGLAGGATDDYYITKGIPYSFTFELPGKDKRGNKFEFLLPASNIKRVGNQLHNGLFALATALKKD